MADWKETNRLPRIDNRADNREPREPTSPRRTDSGNNWSQEGGVDRWRRSVGQEEADHRWRRSEGNVRQPILPHGPRPDHVVTRPQRRHGQGAEPPSRSGSRYARELSSTPLFGDDQDLAFLNDCTPRTTVDRDRSENYGVGAFSQESPEVQDAMEAASCMHLHAVYAGTGVEDPPRVLDDNWKGCPTELHEVPAGAEASVLLCYADFLDVACSVIKVLKRARSGKPLIPVVLRPSHGVVLFKLSSVAMTLKKGGADNVIMQPRDKMDLRERLHAAIGFVRVRWEYERTLMETPDVRANSLFFDVVDQLIEGFPRINHSMEETMPTRNSLGGVGRHAFTSALGEGKFGKVFTTAASDRPDAPCEAVKVISKRNIKTAKHCNQVLKECRLMQKVRHPNVAEFRGLVHAVWHVYIFMEFVGTVDLAAVIKSGRNGQLTSSYVLEIFLQICDAVAFCHQMLVAHRDIKSENVVVTNDDVPKLVDFGLSVQLSNSTTPELCCDKCGTIPFAPPEVYRGKKFDAAAMDVWGLGIMVLEMRCGNNSVCSMLGCIDACEPNDELADVVEHFFSNPDWPQVVQDKFPGVGLAEELLVILRNSLEVKPELRWCAADLWRHTANSNVEQRITTKSEESLWSAQNPGSTGGADETSYFGQEVPRNGEGVSPNAMQ